MVDQRTDVSVKPCFLCVCLCLCVLVYSRFHTARWCEWVRNKKRKIQSVRLMQLLFVGLDNKLNCVRFIYVFLLKFCPGKQADLVMLSFAKDFEWKCVVQVWCECICKGALEAVRRNRRTRRENWPICSVNFVRELKLFNFRETSGRASDGQLPRAWRCIC